MAKSCKVAWHEGLQWQSVHTENGQILLLILMSSPKFQDSKKRTVAAHTIKMCNKSWFVFDFASFLYYFPASGHDNFLMLTSSSCQQQIRHSSLDLWKSWQEPDGFIKSTDTRQKQKSVCILDVFDARFPYLGTFHSTIKLSGFPQYQNLY
jgi:hypothetical protein